MFTCQYIEEKTTREAGSISSVPEQVPFNDRSFDFLGHDFCPTTPDSILVQAGFDHGPCCSQARHNERLRLARELHDRLGLHTSMLFLHLSGLSGAGASADLPTSAGTIERLVDRLESELRSILIELTAAASKPPDLEIELQALLRQFAESSGCTTNLKLARAASRGVPDTVLSGVIRVAQEALNNILKHASKAQCVSVELKRTARYLSLVVENSGASSESVERQSPVRRPSSSGRGLHNMRERLLALHGALRVEVLPDLGFRVTARIPLAPAS